MFSYETLFRRIATTSCIYNEDNSYGFKPYAKGFVTKLANRERREWERTQHNKAHPEYRGKGQPLYCRFCSI